MDIDTLPIPNVGNNIFYKEFSIGAMLPQIGLSGKEASPGHEYD